MCGLIGGAVLAPLPLATISHRGPDASAEVTVGPWQLGHTRLAIQDLSSASEQPFSHGSIMLTYNGELWQPARLRSELGGVWRTSGDTEVVAECLNRYGVDGLAKLDGMFALAWVDAEGRLILARDPYGEVPLHVGRRADSHIVYASELRAILALGADPRTVSLLAPGCALIATSPTEATVVRWYERPAPQPVASTEALMEQATLGRLTTDAPLALLLSGGLDSSLIAAMALPHLTDAVAYTAVHHQASPDLKAARTVAEALGLTLVEVPVPAPSSSDLARTVGSIEMPHKAQVEIAWACLHLARAVASDGVRVVVSGEGADELLASYAMAYHGIIKHGWDGYRSRTFTDQHRKNFPRTNKVFMRSGVEARLPFLHPPLVSTLLSATQEEVTEHGRHPKAILASIAESRGVPAAVAWRAKAAFQTAARLDLAAAAAVADPRAFYRAEFQRQFQGVKP